MNEKITLPTLTQMLALRTGDSKKQSEDFLREFFGAIADALEAGEQVKIKDLGVFKTIGVESRKSVNVSTGEEHEIPAHRKVVFVPSKELAALINEPFEMFETVILEDDMDAALLEGEGSEEYLVETKEEPAAEEESEEASEIYTEEDTERTTESETETESEPEPEPEAEVETEKEAEPEPEAEVIIEPEAEAEAETEAEVKTEPEPEVEAETEAAIETEPDILDNREQAAKHESKSESESESEQKERVVPVQEKENDFERELSLGAELPDDSELDKPIKVKKSKFWQGFLCGLVCMALIGVTIYFCAGFFNNQEEGFSWFRTGTEQGAEITEEKQTAVVDAEEGAIGTSEEEVEPEAGTDMDGEEVTQQETEEEVPTKPSDNKVYDTITTTRYLTTMAKDHYGNYHLWPYIYEENKAFLGHPDRIKPGTRVVVPDLSKYGVDPKNPEDIAKAKRKGVEIYSRYK